MKRTRPLRLGIVFEYGAVGGDWMIQSFVQAMSARLPGLRVDRIHGAFAKYRPGGLHPQRLINLAWVYGWTACYLMFGRADAVIVRTSPPGIQLWAAWWAKWRGTPIVCWLMDYHPEIEARWLERRGIRLAAEALRSWDRSAMGQFELIVALDPAMAAIARSRANGAEVVEHPTWSAPKGDFAVLPAENWNPNRPLNLVYAGNLGATHPLAALERLLAGIHRRRPIRLFVAGASPESVERLRALGAALGIPVTDHDRVPFAELGRLYREWQIDAGIVLLAENSAGLVSPSKFAGYIDYGLPFVYVGPADTNAAIVCDRFGGGFRLAEAAGTDETSAVVERLLDGPALAQAGVGARAAARHFAALNAESLADAIAPRLARNGET